MAQVTINVHGPFSDLKPGDYIYHFFGGRCRKSKILSVDYAIDDDHAGWYKVAWFNVDSAADSVDPEEIFRTEKEALEHELNMLDEEIRFDEKALVKRREHRQHVINLLENIHA